ncbi:hypothetical protein BC332_22298 [Capsicum chinense]|nr:hypothetical protein FXO37_35290 [Capsicum annuum]PHU10438.1 hypothetical protein BC332_22298 [Capsicum chinense]
MQSIHLHRRLHLLPLRYPCACSGSILITVTLANSSFREAHRLFLNNLSTTIILTDRLHGFLLSASIVFIFLGATSLRDYFRHLLELGGQEADGEDDGDRNAAAL